LTPGLGPITTAPRSLGLLPVPGRVSARVARPALPGVPYRKMIRHNTRTIVHNLSGT